MTEPKPKRTGTIHRYAPAKQGEAHGHYVVRCSAPDGSRPLFHLDPSPKSPQARARALETAGSISEALWEKGLGAALKRPRAVKAGHEGETVTEYAKRWFQDREARGLSSIKKDAGRLARHVEVVIGTRPIKAVTRDEIRAVVEHLDRTVRQGVFAWPTALKVWGLVTKMFADSAESKTATLRVRGDNPALGVRGPDRGESKSKQWLYPSEVTALLGFATVPIRWRRLYALNIYLYLRPGELAALEWKDVNLEQRYVSIHKALDLRSGEIKSTKTGITRKVPIRPELAGLLEVMRSEVNGMGAVLQYQHENKEAEHGFPPIEDLAATLRTHLLRAGVNRADLHEDRTTTKRVTFYDLRATGITWEVLDGTEHVRIMQRAGHKHFSTTQGYIREAEAVGIDAGKPFPALPSELSQDLSQESGPGVSYAKSLSKRSVPKGIRKPQHFTNRHDLSSIRDRSQGPIMANSDAKGSNAGGCDSTCDSTSEPADDDEDPVENALAEALKAAAAAAQWTVVATLAGELQARAKDVKLDAERLRRRR